MYIRAWSDLRINDVFIEQKEVGAGRAVIAGHVELDADKDMNGVLVTITDEVTGRVLGEWQADLKRGTNQVTVDLSFTSRSCGGVMDWGSLFFIVSVRISLQVGNCWTLKPKGWAYAL